ncbi:MAG: CHASE domain-containing protein, partial [Burkholderiales bacterium]|nr:CHASE domain-containing protein [Burkholderiales bacterium]
MRGILRRGRSGGGGRWPGRALVALAAGLAFTAAIVAALVDSTAARDRSLFEENARAAQDAVTDRVETAIALLRGAAGLFASQRESVPYEAFRAYMARVALREQYPGLLGSGYTRRIAPDELAAVTAQARAEGQAGFRVWPADERAEYHAILFLEPLDERNRAAIGYDMSTNPVRRAAMERARDQGAASASGMVELVQEIDSRKQPGFLIYLPVYRGGVVPAGVEARREALVGYVYAPIRGGDFLSSAFAHETVPRVALRVFHGRGEAGGVMIYEHAPPDAPEAPRFTLRSTADVAGQAWTFVASSATSAAAGLAVPAMIAAAGILLSVTLAALLWRDATARDAIQVALSREQAARSQAERANRMKDDFLATLSHELRTPLNAIVGWAAVLRQGRISEAQAQAGIEAIDRNAKAQARLIDDLLDMNRIVSGKLRVDLGPLDPVPVVDEAIAAVLPTARDKGVRLERQFAGEPLRVRADASRLRQIAWNLLTNAVKFTPQGGEVRVTLDRDGARARLAVRDTGAGIEPAFLAHVFDRFAQGDSTITRHHGGLGLGLAIVRELVALHGGEVRALSDGP